MLDSDFKMYKNCHVFRKTRTQMNLWNGKQKSSNWPLTKVTRRKQMRRWKVWKFPQVLLTSGSIEGTNWLFFEPDTQSGSEEVLPGNATYSSTKENMHLLERNDPPIATKSEWRAVVFTLDVHLNVIPGVWNASWSRNLWNSPVGTLFLILH